MSDEDDLADEEERWMEGLNTREEPVRFTKPEPGRFTPPREWTGTSSDDKPWQPQANTDAGGGDIPA